MELACRAVSQLVVIVVLNTYLTMRALSFGFIAGGVTIHRDKHAEVLLHDRSTLQWR